jgi:hypothetical protein
LQEVFRVKNVTAQSRRRVTQAVETVEKVGKFNNYCKAMGFYKPEEPNGKIQTL